MKLSITIITLSLILFSCSDKDDADIKITILDKEINVPFYEENWNNINYINNYKNQKVVRVNFKIENTSNSNYLFCPISKDLIKGNAPFNAFPTPLKGLSLNNFIIKDETGKVIESEIGNVLGGQSECAEELIQNTNLFFNKMGDSISDYDAMYKGLVSRSLFIIPNKATLYFQSYIGLPMNVTDFEMSDIEVIDIKSEKKYSIQMIFSADNKVVKERLTNGYKKTLKEGGFKIFNGSIYSNKIPLIINNTKDKK
ncbi:hypothetical protein [Tenacibaculum sp. Bg11-29]|uniref:hypothetical protein n=1 Tax=Tenacibaculum sp. Bg11-29 TaxID=2058306 RepID=UPI0012FF5561|nr:hypothetical protein [Tenacibaculum sp. Bg11-29]